MTWRLKTCHVLIYGSLHLRGEEVCLRLYLLIHDFVFALSYEHINIESLRPYLPYSRDPYQSRTTTLKMH